MKDRAKQAKEIRKNAAKKVAEELNSVVVEAGTFMTSQLADPVTFLARDLYPFFFQDFKDTPDGETKWNDLIKRAGELPLLVDTEIQRLRFHKNCVRFIKNVGKILGINES